MNYSELRVCIVINLNTYYEYIYSDHIHEKSEGFECNYTRVIYKWFKIYNNRMHHNCANSNFNINEVAIIISYYNKKTKMKKKKIYILDLITMTAGIFHTKNTMMACETAKLQSKWLVDLCEAHILHDIIDIYLHNGNWNWWYIFHYILCGMQNIGKEKLIYVYLYL